MATLVCLLYIARRLVMAALMHIARRLVVATLVCFVRYTPIEADSVVTIFQQCNTYTGGCCYS